MKIAQINNLSIVLAVIMMATVNGYTFVYDTEECNACIKSLSPKK